MAVDRDYYEPYPHPTVRGSYRVPVWVDPGQYQVCIAPKTYRYFNEQTVPDKIVALLAMIRAIPFKERDYEWPHQTYVNMQDKRLDEIGWKVDDILHMLVLDHEFLFSLHGQKNG